MHWGTERFQELYDALGGSALEGRLAPGVAESAQVLSEDLKAVLAAPPKSDASRSTLAKRVVKLEDGLEYKLSTEFANAAAQLADDLNLDEIAAANLVLASASNASRMAVPPASAALAMFHIRRQYILNTLLYVCEQLPLCEPSSLLAKQLTELFSLVFVSDPGPVMLTALQTVEMNLRELHERAVRARVLGISVSQRGSDEDQVQRAFLLEQHQTLGCLVFALVRLGKITASTALDITKHALTLEVYDTILLAYAAPLSLFYSLFDKITAPAERAITLGNNNKPDAACFVEFFTKPSAEELRLPWWRGVLAALFLTFRLGQVSEESEDERETIMAALRTAIDEGALEGLMSIAKDLSREPLTPMFTDFEVLMRSRVPPVSVSDQPALERLAERFKPILELYFEATVTNAADLLQEMRLNEEDSYLALASEGPKQGTSEVSPGRDLERFFLFVSHLFADQPAAAEVVWADHDGSMYGFIAWAAQCQSALMPAAFAEMLASISSSPSAAHQAWEFLRSGSGDASHHHEEGSNELTWDSILDILVFYRRGLGPKAPRSLLNDASSPLVNSHGPIAKRRSNELDDYSILRINAILRVLSATAQNCKEVRQQCLKEDPQLKVCILSVLVDYLRVQNPFFAPIFWTLGCFAGRPTEESVSNAQIWNYINDWAYKKDVKTSDGASVHSLGVERLDRVLNYVADAVALLRLVRKLFEGLSPKLQHLPDHLQDYAKFAIQRALPFQQNCNRMSAKDSQRLLREGLLLLKQLVDPLNGSVERLKRAGVFQDVLHQDTMLAKFLDSFPSAFGWDACHSSQVSKSLLEILTTNLETIDQSLVSSDIVCNVLLAGEIVKILLGSNNKRGQKGPSFDELLLEHVETVPSILMYTGSNHCEVVMMSIELVSLIDRSDAFAAGPSHKSRMVSVLDSMLDAERVRLGLVWQLSTASEQNDEQSMRVQHQIRLSILELILSSLERNARRSRPCLAHALLGFDTLGGSVLTENPKSPCGVGSQTSLLDSICELLTASLEETSTQCVGERPASVISLCSQILATLLRHPSSSKTTITLLRSSKLLHRVLRVEPIVTANTVWDTEPWNAVSCQASSSSTLVSFLKHRAALIEMLSYDLHALLREKLHSSLSQYIEELLDTKREAGKSVINMLDFLKFDTMQTSSALDWPVQPARVTEKLMNLPGDHATELATLLKLQNCNKGQTQATIALYSRDKANDAIRAAQLQCLQAWCSLVSVVVSDVPYYLGALPPLFVSETVQALIPKLTLYSRHDIAFRKPVASLLVLLLERNHGINLKADFASSRRLLWLYEAALTSVQMALKMPDLRADLYTICYQSLLMCFAEGGSEPSQMLQPVLNGSEYLLHTLCQDASRGTLRLQLSALIFIKALLRSERSSNSSQLEQRLLHADMPRRLIESLRLLDSGLRLGLLSRSAISENTDPDKSSSSSNKNKHADFKESAGEGNVMQLVLTILLHLAQTREGARLVLQSGLLQFLEATGLLAADADDVSRAKMPLLVFQLLAAVAVSLGTADRAGIEVLRSFMSACQPLTAKILRADASSQDLSNTKPSNQLADVVVLLYDLTGMPPRPTALV